MFLKSGKEFLLCENTKLFDIFYNVGQNFCFGRIKKKFTDCYFIEKKKLHISICVSIGNFLLFLLSGTGLSVSQY